MKFLNNLTVQAKLGFAFAFVLALMLLLGGFAILQMSRVYTEAERIMDVRLSGVRDSLKMSEAATRYRTREYRVLISSADELSSSVARLEDGNKTFQAARQDYEKGIADAEERKLFETAVAAWQNYQQRAQQLVQLMQAGKNDEANEFVSGKEALSQFDAANSALHDLAEYNDTHAKMDAERADQLYDNGRNGVIAVMLVALAVGIAFAWLIGRAIALPLREAAGLAEAVAAGDLTRSLSANGKDEVASLTRALGQMVDRLRGVVGEVRSGVESVSTASTQIATGNADLSQRTEEQASNLQQTAASMEEITSTVTQNAENARAASQLASGATQVATQGGEVVSKVVDTMREITDSSKKISDIIGVIDSIAFQTNILALNAAVEAARAGEQGRGFAVVASEVRNLAQRSAEAAKEIKSLIQQSVEKVDSGAVLVEQAGRTMDDVVQQVRRVNDLVGEIAEASQEQSKGIAQVGAAVAQLDQVTQQNAALVEESAAAADSMQQQAARLAETVSVFNIGASARVSTPARSAKPAPARAPAARAAFNTSAKSPVRPTASPSPSPAPSSASDSWESF